MTALKPPQRATKNLRMRREVEARAESLYQNRARRDLIARLTAAEETAFLTYQRVKNAITHKSWLMARDALREAKGI